MECPQCKTVNDDKRRFCSSCGYALVSICARCDSVNEFKDKFCGVCGAKLTGLLSQEHLFSAKALGDSKLPKQYASEDLEELLSLRIILRQEKIASERLTQDDLDALFN